MEAATKLVSRALCDVRSFGALEVTGAVPQVAAAAIGFPPRAQLRPLGRLDGRRPLASPILATRISPRRRMARLSCSAALGGLGDASRAYGAGDGGRGAGVRPDLGPKEVARIVVYDAIRPAVPMAARQRAAQDRRSAGGQRRAARSRPRQLSPASGWSRRDILVPD